MFIFDLDAIARKLMDEFRPEFEATATGTDNSGWNSRAFLIHRDGHHSIHSFGAPSREERRRRLQVIAGIARVMDVLGVILLMDISGVSHDHLPAEIKAPPGTADSPATRNEFTARFSKWLKANYGGRIANMPPEMRLDAFQAGIKEPHRPDRTWMQRYRVVGHEVVWIDAEPTKVLSVINMMPNWWEPFNDEAEALIAEVIRAKNSADPVGEVVKIFAKRCGPDAALAAMQHVLNEEKKRHG